MIKNRGISIHQIGEFGLIDSIKKQILSKDKRVLVNIGDDAAVISSSPDKFVIFTTDTMVERVHFDLKYCTFEEIGWKAMTANLSDIAAMGGLPKYALVTIGLPRSMKAGDVFSIYTGAAKIAGEYKCKIIGGDTTLVPKHLFISIALLGEVDKKTLVTRSGAKKDDLICVSGNLGEAQAGLEYLKRFGRRKYNLIRKHLKPLPQIKLARNLIKHLRVNSMIDISDGLSSELFHLAEESKLGVLVHERNIPLSPVCLKIASLLKKDPMQWSLSSGEEYELLFTVDRKDSKKIENIKSGLGISVIGQMVSSKQGLRLVKKSGSIRSLNRSGFSHF